MQNKMQNDLAELFADKKILIWGAGREGLSTYRFLRGHFPQKNLTIASPNNAGLPLDDGLVTHLSTGDWIGAFSSFDVIFKSPGIPTYQKTVDLEKLTSQTALFLRFFRTQTIGITGTKGKSTTTALLHHILKENGKNAILMGNIGIPCLDYFDFMQPDSIAVFEMSCHQLEYLSVSPHISVVLNLLEDHLDHYGTRDNYHKAKKNIFLHQSKEDIVVANLDDEHLLRDRNAVFASMTHDADIYPTDCGFSVLGENVALENLEEPLKEAPSNAGGPLLGRHNRYNTAIAYYLCHTHFAIEKEDFLKALKTFAPLPHRLQNIGTYDGVTYYNDSISTVSETTIQALLSLPEVDTLILGGMDRGIDYTPLTDFLAIHFVAQIILLPDTSDRLYPVLSACCDAKLFMVDCLEQAVAMATKITARGRICLLSPAAASYNHFENFEHRGIVFEQLVKQYSSYRR